MAEFTDRNTAKACFDSPEYQATKIVRQKYADPDFNIIDGAG